MDPLSVLKTMWTHKWVTVPMVLLIGLACAYSMLWAPRTYESTATFALAMPKIPTEQELEEEPSLAKLNADNPYLRWQDTSLLAQVVIDRVNSAEVHEGLVERGLEGEYELSPPDGTSSGLMKLTVSADSKQSARDTVGFLSAEFSRILYEVQKVNQADDLYVIDALPVSGPTPAEEIFSSRLRSTLLIGAAGLVVLFGVVSLAESVRAARQRSRSRAEQRAAGATESTKETGTWVTAADPALRGNAPDLPVLGRQTASVPVPVAPVPDDRAHGRESPKVPAHAAR
ncbi:chain-length determining protein [Citricoccus sp. GCM10030269]|uniref:chain-length determining protein n=1 Tax=Citricoccus sp. GCM10030269 TaxID=3273388 RepID=UPI00360A19C0